MNWKIALIAAVGLLGCGSDGPGDLGDTGIIGDLDGGMDVSTGMDVGPMDLGPTDVGVDGDAGGDDAEVDMGAGPCGGEMCEATEVCDASETCVPRDCGAADACGATEECVPQDVGALCVDISCASDLQCPIERFCDASGVCVDDTCVPFVQRCSPTDPLVVEECAANGGGFGSFATCPGGLTSAGTASECTAIDATAAGCTCVDDWDCPGSQTCDVGTCTGSVEAPTCRLPAADITDVLPAQEVVWGGANASDVLTRLRLVDGADVPLASDDPPADGPAPAELSPWASVGQVTQTPIVANLDDDNGDGRIDERDVPEVLFLTFSGSGDANSNGVLRAIHGGGTFEDGSSRKGRDYLAVCGDNRWLSGAFFDSTGETLTDEPACGDAAELDPGSTLAVGNLDYDEANQPEIVVFGQAADGDGFDVRSGRIFIFDNEGREIFRSELLTFENVDSSAENPGVTLANVVPSADPADELVEIIIGRDVFILESSPAGLTIANRLSGADPSGVSTGAALGTNGQGPVNCVADLIAARPGLEIVAGTTVYGVPLTDAGELDVAASTLAPLGSAGRNGFCAIADVWGADTNLAPGPANTLDESPELVVIDGGNVYVYTIASALVDDDYEVTLTPIPGANGLATPGGGEGGAPNIDDFDGDGFPEVGTAARSGYVVFDFQGASAACPAWSDFQDNQSTIPRTPPATTCSEDADCNSGDPSSWAFACNEAGNSGAGACVCLHNGWQRITQDRSSNVTGSSVFDFNGDGAAEVVYNDECHFRVYDGLAGDELFLEPSEGRTRIEYPIVADVDNDGNAEIIFASSNESGFCTNASQSADCTAANEATVCPSFGADFGQSCVADNCTIVPPAGSSIANIRDIFNNGIEIWGDPSDRWVGARRVWNQYSYHVTNVNESGVIPRFEPNSWQPLGSRFFNTYRSQPRSFGVAPDLTVDRVQVSSPDAACGMLSTQLTISVSVTNIGDLRVGAGVQVAFIGVFPDGEEILLNAEGDPLLFTLTSTLEPRGTLIFEVGYAAANNGRTELPMEVRVIIDPASSLLDPGDTTRPDGAARECDESNNELAQMVAPGEQLADLRLTLEDTAGDCPNPTIAGEVTNDGSLPAENVVVRIFAGDPAAGGMQIADVVIEGPIAPGESESFTATLDEFPENRTIRVFGVVDPDGAIEECNDANNTAGPTAERQCVGLL
ncbi:MAG: hypothetical protein AAF938_04885 [Myxococcota bacterium]